MHFSVVSASKFLVLFHFASFGKNRAGILPPRLLVLIIF